MNDMVHWGIPLLVVGAAKEVRGKTRMQKLVFLIQDETKNEWFRYENYLHGPFSAELSRAVDELKSSGCIAEKIAITPSGYQLHVYTITDKGESVLEAIQSKDDEIRGAVAAVGKITDSFGEMDLKDLLAEVYARAGLTPKA